MEEIRRPSRSLSAPVVETTKTSPLSSPFMAKLSLSDASKSKKPQSPSADDPVQVDDVFYSGPNPSISTPPLSPSPDHHQPGGELERVRSQIVDEAMAQIEQAEHRRPDYFKRVKRTQESQTDDERDHPLPGVEITVSPHKGRRLTLFQETSEESFEESLLAGGYGRYVRLPWIDPNSSDTLVYSARRTGRDNPRLRRVIQVLRSSSLSPRQNRYPPQRS